MIDFQTAPILYKKHATDRLRERFQMKTEEVRHYLKTGKYLKKVEKDGEIVIIQSEIGDTRMRCVFTVRSGMKYDKVSNLPN